MTAAQNCFLFEISQSNASPIKNSGKELFNLKSDETQPEQLLSLFYFPSN